MQENKGGNRSDDSRSQNIFHRENGPTNGEELQQDEAFRAFFTQTVIEVPEDMRHITGGILLNEEEEEKPKKKGFWPWSRHKAKDLEWVEDEPKTVADPAPEDDFDDDDEEILEMPSLVEFDQEEPAPQPKTKPVPKAELKEKPAPQPITAPTEPKAQPAPTVIRPEPVQKPKAEPKAPEKPAAPPPKQDKPEEKPKAAAPVTISAKKLMEKTAKQAVSVDELLSQISQMEQEPEEEPVHELASTELHAVQQPKPAEKPVPKREEERKEEPKPEPIPEIKLEPKHEPKPSSKSAEQMRQEEEASLQRLREQTAAAAEGKTRLDAMLASLYEKQAEAQTSSMKLVEEEPGISPQREDQDTDTVEIPLHLPQQPEEKPRPELDVTGEIDFSEMELVEDEPELSALPLEQEHEEDTGEICFDEMEKVEDEEEELPPVSMEEPQFPTEESEKIEDGDEDEPEGEPKKNLLRRLMDMLGLDGSDEEGSEEETSEEAGQADAESAEDKAEPEPCVKEYTNPDEAPQVQELLQKRCGLLTLFTALSGILAVALLVIDVTGQVGSNLITGLDPIASPATWLCVNLILLVVCAALDGRNLLNGLQSLLPDRTPTTDGLTALSVCAAVLQLVLALVLPKEFDPAKNAVFAGVAALMVFMGLLGKRMAAAADRDGFEVMTSGVDHATAYRLEDRALAQILCDGMEENDPAVMLSRPDALMSDFMAQSAAPHYCDERSQLVMRMLGGAALIGALISLIRGGTAVGAASVLAGVLCMGVPLGMLMLRGVSSLLMQRASSQVGAVVPGWPAIEKLGEVDVIQVDASELFPPICAHLNGIKTFQKERIDSAILYATSVLIAGCNTLEGLFRGMIENHTEMLYPVKDLESRSGRGFVAWCDHCRVVLGTRELMQDEGIPLPALDYEKRYTKDGASHVLYLAVSGKLYAMFLFGYNGTKQVAHTLNTLRRENIRLLITAQDPTLTEKRIEDTYRLRPGFVKVLNTEEQQRLAPAVAYLPSQKGCMAHLGGFASMVGGLRAAAAAQDAQHSGCTIQFVSAVVSIVIGLLLSVTGGMASISLGAVLLYQLAWAALSIAIAATKKY